MLTMFVRIASPLALASLSVPAVANPHPQVFSPSSYQEARGTLFAGLTIRLGLDGRREQSPEVALRFAGATHERGMLPRIGEGLALTASTGGKPRLTLAGKDSATAGEQLGLSKTGKTALIIGAVVVVALGIGFLIVKDQLDDDMEGDRISDDD